MGEAGRMESGRWGEGGALLMKRTGFEFEMRFSQGGSDSKSETDYKQKHTEKAEAETETEAAP